MPETAQEPGRPPGRAPAAAVSPTLPRDFTFALPLFLPASAWNQGASTAAVHPSSDAKILVTYRVLCGDVTDLHPVDDPPTTDWPFADVGYDEYALPIFRAGSGTQSVLICDYGGALSYPNPKWGVGQEGGPIEVPSAAGNVRPAGPLGIDSDGHLILYDGATGIEYDFWQATTVRSGECLSQGGGLVGPAILEAGFADFFDTRRDATNPDGLASARAVGTSLLAGMILPEDVESGSIGHALALAVPGPRNLAVDPQEPLASDYVYPAATTETDFYSTSANALIAGERLRLKGSLVDDTGSVIDEVNDFAPITRMLIAALREYGAYVVDNGAGFTFEAEDIHTAVLDLTDDEVNVLVGRSPGTPLPTDKTKWQLVIETLNLALEKIPFAYGGCSGASSTIVSANYEVIVPAAEPIFVDGFESGDGGAWSLRVP